MSIASRTTLQEMTSKSNLNPHEEIKTIGKGNYIGKYKRLYYMFFFFLLMSGLKDHCIKQNF